MGTTFTKGLLYTRHWAGYLNLNANIANLEEHVLPRFLCQRESGGWAIFILPVSKIFRAYEMLGFTSKTILVKTALRHEENTLKF